MFIVERERTSTEVIMYALYLYFLGLSFRNTSKAIRPFEVEGRSHVAIWKWVQKSNPDRISCLKRVSAFLIDETMLQIGNEEAWVMGCGRTNSQTNSWSLSVKTQEYDSC